MIEFFPADMRRNPFPYYDQFREASPVLHLAPFGFWMIFDYDGVKHALENHAAFSSGASAPGSAGKPLDWLVFNDPPRHTRMRALINRAFVPRIVAGLEPRIRQISGQLLEAFGDGGEFDLVAGYSSQLPIMVIAELLGIPMSDRTAFKAWADVIMNLANTVAGGEAGAEAAQNYGLAKCEIDAYLTNLLAERRQSPREDLLSQLTQVEVDGTRLTFVEIAGFFQLLLAAGSETTINLINNAVLSLLEHPQQLELLREQPALIPSAIEEVLRYRSPLQAVFRQTTCEVQLHGQLIPPQELVLPLIGSANRDPRHFPDPNTFNVAREPNPHMAFGHGIHFCLGASLSRLEARVALDDLLGRFSSLALAGDEPWEPRPAFLVHGPLRLPLRLTRSKKRRPPVGQAGGLGGAR